jgi:hypothetical protein
MLFLSLFGAWIASCSDDTQTACTPGTTRRCAGISRCEGVEVCGGDGSGYGQCDCSGAPRKPGDVDPATTTAAVVVGRACTDDAKCGAGLHCLTSTSNDFFGGGPAEGYCSLACSDDAECAAIDRQSECIGAPDGTGLCVRTCFSQDPTSADENKCLGRRDLACQSQAYLGIAQYTGSRQKGWCYPQCGSDEDCGSRRCDLSLGLCTDTPAPTGSPIGAHCDTAEDCAGGVCIQLGPSDRFCSAPCVFGQPVGCGYGLSANPREAGCLAPRVTGILSSEGESDIGFCAELCSQTSDCAQAESAGWFCRIDPGAQNRLGRPGVCRQPVPVGDAGADAADATPDASGPSGGSTPDGG